MGNDIDWIKQALKNITPKIETMHTTFTEGEGKIKVLNKAVFGNGKEGIKDKLDNVERKIDETSGFNKAWATILGSGFGITIILVILQALNIIR
jgi:hypothetical protein